MGDEPQLHLLRAKKRQKWKLVFANITTWGPKAQAWLCACDADVVMYTEHHLRAQQVHKIRVQLRRHGWKIAATAARSSDNGGTGTSGGTLIAWRAHIAITPAFVGVHEDMPVATTGCGKD